VLHLDKTKKGYKEKLTKEDGDNWISVDSIFEVKNAL
jgi:hypothetical protein